MCKGNNIINLFSCTDLRFDPEEDRWTSVKPMHTKRLGVGVAVVNRLLYVVGGYDGTERLGSGECYHPENNAWTMIAPMTTQRSGAGNFNIVSSQDAHPRTYIHTYMHTHTHTHTYTHTHTHTSQYYLYVFIILALSNINTYVTNQQMHTNKMWFIIHYYSSTCFSHFCYHHQGVIQEYKSGPIHKLKIIKRSINSD